MTSIPNDPTLPIAATGRWRDYLELTKPKVSLLIVFTAVVGMVLASPGMVPLLALVFGTLGIAMASGSAAAFNHVLDRRIDEKMLRTRRRPLPTGHLQKKQAVVFASLLGAASMLVLWTTVGGLTAALTFCSLIGYAMVYTVWLKRATPQNIVIGGAAGAAPPVLGWAAVTHSVDPQALMLFLIIFTWTPPHFWALAIARRDDYAKVGIPMLPVTHGIPYTRLHILLYTILLVLSTLLPVLTGMSGMTYLAAALVLNCRFYILYSPSIAPPAPIYPCEPSSFPSPISCCYSRRSSSTTMCVWSSWPTDADFGPLSTGVRARRSRHIRLRPNAVFKPLFGSLIWAAFLAFLLFPLNVRWRKHLRVRNACSRN